ncbi:MAG: hypothetical protein PHC43_09380 [Candidatus Marinimicrobia bacterium]|nr:hypothetical protein [Candidatus Neomarinimicrobiota bacterium]
MADTNIYYFPGNALHYDAKVGEIFFRIWYTFDWDNAIEIDTDCLNLESLNIPLEADPGAKTFRYANMKVTFAYSALIENMLADIIAQGKREATFIDMYIDGDIYWRGMMIWENTKKNDYYINSSSNVLYKSITFDFNDAFYYLSKNNKTLSNASYSDGIVISTLLENIIGLMGFSASDLMLDANLSITEECGTSYDLSDLKITGLDSDMLLTEFLKDFMVELGAFIYILKGKVYVVRRSGGTTLPVSNSAIMDLQKLGLNLVGYVNLYINFTDADFWFIDGFSLSKTSGIKNELNNTLNYEHECTLLKKCYIAGTGAFYQPGDGYPSGGDDNELIDSEAEYLVNNIETGDILYYNHYGLNWRYALVLKGITEIKIPFKYSDDLQDSVQTSMEYKIENGYLTTPYPRFKSELLAYMAADAYTDFFLTSPDVFNVILKGISTYDDISKRYVFNSLNHRARNAIINFIENTIYMEWMRVS